MEFAIEITDSAKAEMRAERAFDRQRIADAIDKQLVHEPHVQTRSRKRLDSITADFPFEPPLWELKVGEFRVFYEIDLPARLVVIRAMRRKRPDQMTEDVTHARNDH